MKRQSPCDSHDKWTKKGCQAQAKSGQNEELLSLGPNLPPYFVKDDQVFLVIIDSNGFSKPVRAKEYLEMLNVVVTKNPNNP